MKAGIQLYQFRKYCKTKEDMRETVKKLAETGYDGIELFHPFLLTPKEAIAAAEGAELINPHVELSDLKRPERAAEWAREAGVKSVCFSRLVPLYGIFGLPAVLKTVEKAAHAFEGSGVALCYHNHAAEMKNGCAALTEIAKTGVRLEIDAFWAKKAGANLQNVFTRFGAQADYLHLKDAKPNGKLCALGEGAFDLYEPVRLAKEQGIAWAICDTDRTDLPPFEAATKSLSALRALS